MFTTHHRKIAGATCAAILILGTLPSIAASQTPARALDDVRWGPGDTRRAILWENHNGGKAIYVYGTGNCTASTTVADTQSVYVGAAWNDQISAVNDYNQCDVNLFDNNNFEGGQTGYINYGDGGGHPVYIGDGWNDRASSFKVS